MSTQYPNESDKLTHATLVGKELKSRVIAEEGIGVDIGNTVFGWRDGELVSVATLGRDIRHPVQRIVLTAQAGSAMRRTLGATAFTLLIDGYWAATPGDLTMSERFAGGDTDVLEALFLVHLDKWSPRSTTVRLPYVVKLGRQVEYRMVVPGHVELSEPYCAHLMQALDLEPDAELSPAQAVQELAQYDVQMEVFQ